MMRHLCLVTLLFVTAAHGQVDDANDANAAPFSRPDAADVAAGFVETIEADDALDAQAKARALRFMREAGEDPRDLQVAMTDALIELYPAFGEGIRLLADDEIEAAAAKLKPLVDSSDAYVAAHARYFLARGYSMAERYEQARPLVESVVEDYANRTLYLGEAMFLQGAAQAHTLQRKPAMRTLTRFVAAFPEAPERLRIGAQHLIDQMQAVEEGTISDVSDRMDYSRRKLSIEDTGDRTQTEQQRIVAMLDTLIEQAEQQENQNNQGGGQGQQGGQSSPSGGGGAPQGNQAPSGPASQSTAPAGASRMGALHRVTRGDASDQWGQARQREREEVLNAIKARYPDRYRELVEQYYRSMQDEDR